MRSLLAPAVARTFVPDRAALDAVRQLGRRFPEARLRQVPLVRAADLDERADPSGGTRVWLALEALQVTGSFKVRGALVALAAATDRRHVVAASGGNHGVAVAYCACLFGMAATVVVPRATPPDKLEKIHRYGAELVVAEAGDGGDAEVLAQRIALKLGASVLTAQDDVDVALGNGGSLGFEIVHALGGVPERVLVPFGRGGLAAGLAWAFEADVQGPHDRGVWGVESEMSCAMALSLERATAVAVEEPRSTGTALADSLQGGLSANPFARARAAIAGVVVASEAQIAAAMVHAYRDMGLVLEGGAALALAPALFGLPEGLRGGDLVVILTGRNVGREQLEAVLADARVSGCGD